MTFGRVVRALVLTSLLSIIYAGDGCPFQVIVKTPMGVPVSNVPVVFSTMGDAEVAPLLTDRNGMAVLCDPPFDSSMRLRLIVGVHACRVIVENVAPPWKRTRSVYVTYEPCNPDELFGFCRIALKLKDETGSPVAGVALTPTRDIDLTDSTVVSDRFGRLLLTKGWKSVFEIHLRKAGFQPVDMELACDPNKSTSERIVRIAHVQ